MSENDHSQKDSAELNKWRRKIARLEDDYETGERNLKDYLRAAFGKGVSATRINLAREIKRSETEKPLAAESYGFKQTQDGEITGLEQFPWNRGLDGDDE